MEDEVIPLRNKKKEIIDYTLISPEDFKYLNKFRWSKSDGYAMGTIKGKTWKMHIYIWEILHKKERPIKKIIDHKNRNKLDNTFDNLRLDTYSNNSRNKKKKENLTSKYYGVSLSKNKWRVNILLPIEKWDYEGYKPLLIAYYDNELHAAHQYNLWLTKFDLNLETKNNIEIPTDFVEWKSKNENKELPIGITKRDNSFRIVMNFDGKKLNKTVKTLEEAVKVLEEYKKQREEYFKQKLLNIPILRKKYFDKNLEVNKFVDVCYFIIEKNEIKYEVIIDEDKYYKIIQYSWSVSEYLDAKNNIKYIKIKGGPKYKTLSRFIKNYDGEKAVDHKNGDTLDNRECNLRIVSHQQNSQNRTKSNSENLSSKYIGISKTTDNKKWRARISKNGKEIHIGRFDTEIEAAQARDKFVLLNREEYSHTKLNFSKVNYKIKDGNIEFVGTTNEGKEEI